MAPRPRAYVQSNPFAFISLLSQLGVLLMTLYHAVVHREVEVLVIRPQRCDAPLSLCL
jgi:hypothetical protein